MLYKDFQTIYPGRYDKNSSLLDAMIKKLYLFIVKEIMVVKIPHCFCVSVMDSLRLEVICVLFASLV